jgi:mono/diheme cytochrome c family protein
MTSRGRPNVALLTALASVMAGCGASGNDRAREYMPDMARGPAYKAFAPNAATRTGLTLQMPVAGTIARGHQVFHFGPGEEEAARAGRELTNPLRLSAETETIEDGRGLYQTYCLVCHGANGKGDGPLVVAGKIPTPPAYSSVRVAAFPPGRLFHVVTMGTQKMPSYAALLTPGERWKVIAYVSKTLQDTRGEPASSARRAPSREGSGTLRGFPNEKERAAP